MFLVPAGSLDAGQPGERLVVDGGEGRHAGGVVRLRPGDEVLLGDGRGHQARAVVVSSDRRAVTTRIVSVHRESAADPRLVLVQALARGGHDEQALTAATELGVDRIVPWQAARSVVKWQAARAEAGRARWEALAVAATKQSRRHYVPVVDAVAGREQVAQILRQATLALVLHEAASAPLAGVAPPAAGSVAVVVGPEGGIDSAELDAFVAAGAMPVRLGREVLRTSTAGPAALAVLNARSRWA